MQEVIKWLETTKESTHLVALNQTKRKTERLGTKLDEQ